MIDHNGHRELLLIDYYFVRLCINSLAVQAVGEIINRNGNSALIHSFENTPRTIAIFARLLMCAKRFYTLSLGYEKLQNSDTYGLLLSWRLIDSYKGTDSNLSRSPILLILQCIISTLLTFLGEICRTRLSQTTEVATACGRYRWTQYCTKQIM